MYDFINQYGLCVIAWFHYSIYTNSLRYVITVIVWYFVL